MRCLDGENRVGDRDPQKDPSYGPWEGRNVEGGKSLSGREEFVGGTLGTFPVSSGTSCPLHLLGQCQYKG